MASFPFGQAPIPAGPSRPVARRPADASDGRRAGPSDGRLSTISPTLFADYRARGQRGARRHRHPQATRPSCLTPDQSLVSVSGRLVSLPAPLTRQGRRWLVPVEFISRALAPVYERVSTAAGLAAADRRRPPRAARPRAVRREPGSRCASRSKSLRKPTAAVTQEQNRLLVRFDADALDALLPAAATQKGLIDGRPGRRTRTRFRSISARASPRIKLDAAGRPAQPRCY